MFLLRVKGGGHTRKMLHTPHQFSLQILSKMVQFCLVLRRLHIYDTCLCRPMYLWCSAFLSLSSLRKETERFQQFKKTEKKVDFKKTEEKMCCYRLNLP